MSAPRTLLAITGDPDGPVVRHRVRAWAAALAREGVALDVSAWPKGWLARRAVLARAERAGNVWVVGRLLRACDVDRLRVRVRRLLFDLDDALPFRDSDRGASRSATRTERFLAIVRAADAVSAGNAYLADLVRAAGGRATVLPTVVAVPDGDPAPEPPTPPTVLGWIGSRSTLRYLAERAVALAAIVTLHHPFRLRIVSDAFPSMPPGIPVEEVPWTLEGESRALDGMHIGLAPLPDDAWTRGKCGLKVVQVLARGRPVVASAVGVQRDQVRSGETGFLVRTDAELVDALVALLSDPPLRRKMGAAARQDARDRWSVAAWEGRAARFLTEALA